MAFGRTLFKATNWLLFVLGTLMALHAGYMIFRYQQEQQDPTGPSDSPPAAPPQETPFRGSDLWFAPVKLSKEHPKGHNLRNEYVDHSPSPCALRRFVYAYGAIGGHVVATAVAGLIGAACDSKCCLGFHALLLVAMLMLQAALAAALFTMMAERDPLPPDRTEHEEELRDFLMRNRIAADCIGAIIFAVEVLDLVLSLVLQGSSSRGQEDDDDIDAYFERNYGNEARRPLVRPNQQQQQGNTGDPELGRGSSFRSGDESAWSERMRAKYGLDMSNYSYAPTRREEPSQGRRGAQAGTQQQRAGNNNRRGCSVM